MKHCKWWMDTFGVPFTVVHCWHGLISSDVHLIFSLQTHQMGVEEFLFLCKMTNNLYHSYLPPTKRSRTAVRSLFTFLFLSFPFLLYQFFFSKCRSWYIVFCFPGECGGPATTNSFFVRYNTHWRRCRVVLLSHKLNNWAFPRIHILKNDWTCRLEKTFTTFFKESAMSMACIHWKALGCTRGTSIGIW